MARAGLHRRPPEQPQIPHWVGRAMRIYEERRTVVLVVLGLLIAVPVAATLVLRARRAADRDAQAILSRAEGEYYSGNLAAALTFYEDILDRHGSTPTASLAAIGRGRVLLAQAKPQDALATFERARGAKDPLVSAAARRGHAAALEDLRRPAEAAREYEDLARDEADAIGDPAVEDLLAATRAWRAAGDAAHARAALTRIVEQYPQSPRLRDAQLALAELQ